MKKLIPHIAWGAMISFLGMPIIANGNLNIRNLVIVCLGCVILSYLQRDEEEKD